MMTPSELREHEFKGAGRNAYKSDDVDNFFGEVAVAYEKIYRENAELVKRISVDIELDFMDVSSYAGKKSTEVKVNKDIACSVSGKKVLIVEDIVDTGKTLKVVKEMFYTKGAEEVKIVTLLDKPEGRLVEIEPDWCGFITPNEFVIGYGLDYNQKYRNLPYVGVIKPSAI